MHAKANNFIELGLGAREYKALERFGVSTILQFLQFDLQQVLALDDIGNATFARLLKARQSLRDAWPAAPGKRLDACYRLLEDISGLGLSKRGLATLRYYNVKTVNEFLKLDLSGKNYVPNCGVGTLGALLQAQHTLRQEVGCAEGIPPHAEAQLKSHLEALVNYDVRSPLAPHSWNHLPLFSNRPLSGIDAADIHPSYRPELPIHYLRMPERILHCAAEIDIRTLGDLLLSTPRKARELLVIGKYAIHAIQAEVATFFAAQLQDAPGPLLNMRSPDAFLSSLLRQTVADVRLQSILRMRMGGGSPPQTLEEVAQGLDVTRERIRQLEKKAMRNLRNWRATSALRPLHEMIHDMLQESSRPSP